MSLGRSISRTRHQAGFTLVEMLVVLGIIGILVAILLPAVMAAVNMARRNAIALEIKNIEAALTSYKNAKGEYPPSFGERDTSGNPVYNVTTGAKTRYNSAVERHLQRGYNKFIDRNPSAMTEPKDYFFIGGGGFTGANNIDQGEALVLWLSLLSTNADNPIDIVSTRQGFYEFDAKRLVDTDGDGIPTFQPRHCRDTDYLYLEYRTYTTYVTRDQYARSATSAAHQMVPYGSNATTPVNPGTFQIICAGLDGDFGALPQLSGNLYQPKQFPAGVGYTPGDRDNLTNFSGGSTLGDARPQ